MGEVYLARAMRLDRRVALKLLREKRGTEEHRQRFLQEARAASALNHPNIVTVYDVGIHAGIDYIAMEFVDGESLAAILARGPLQARTALKFAAAAADALARAHQAAIVHRDVKRVNLLITRDGWVKFVALGIGG